MSEAPLSTDLVSILRDTAAIKPFTPQTFGQARVSMKEAANEIERLRRILGRAVDVMADLHRSIEPMEDEPDVPGRVPPAAMRSFVDALADIHRERFSRG